MPVDFANDETLDQAITALNGLEANEPKPLETASEQTDSEQQQSAALADETGSDKPNDLQADTPAAAEKKPAEATEKTETQKPTDKPADSKPKSKFGADKERLDKTWKSVNEQKAAQTAKEAALTQREQQIAQREQKAQVAEAKSRNKFTPEQYTAASQNKIKQAETLAIQADGLDRRAEQMEQQGKYAEAEQLKAQAKEKRDESNLERAQARSMDQMADHLRKNPDPTIAQHKATLEQHKRHYLLEAAKRWPEVAKDGSEFQKTMALHLQAAAQQGLDPAENPSVFYHVARLTAAESAAARVPDLEKQLGAAQAKVKELELLVAPGGGKGSAQTQPAARALTDDEEAAELRQQALQR